MRVSLITMMAVVALVGSTGRADFILTGQQHRDVVLPHEAGFLYGTSTAIVRAEGSIGNASVCDSSSLGISGGSANYLDTFLHGRVVVSGGLVHDLSAHDESRVDIFGGVLYDLRVHDDSSAGISGGRFYSLSAYSTSRVTLSGTDFRVSEGLSLDSGIVSGTGLLTGKWLDGTPFTMLIPVNSSQSTITVIPEPATLVLLVLGGLAMGLRRRLMN